MANDKINTNTCNDRERKVPALLLHSAGEIFFACRAIILSPFLLFLNG